MTALSAPDLWAAPVWLLANALLFAGAWRLATALFPRDDALPRVMHALVISWATIVLVSFVLSAMHCLRACLLLVLAAGLGIAALRFVARPDIYQPQADSAALRAATRVLAGRRRHFPFAHRGQRAWLLIWLWYAFVATAAVVAWGLRRFPDDWDSLAYHIPLIDQWLRAQTVENTNSSSWFHPGNQELIGLWCVGIFSGDFLISLASAPPAAILALATRELARRLGARSATAHLAGFAAVTPYVVTRQLLDSENDVAVAALLVASLAYAARWVRRPQAGSLLLWTTSFGLMPGIKYYALGYAAVGAAGVALLAWRWGGARRAAALSTAGLCGAAVLSGYWYLRNYWLTGSPLFPRGFLGGPDMLAETFPYIRQTTLLGNRDPSIPWLLVRAVWTRLGAAHCAAVLSVPVTTACLIGGAVRGPRAAWPGRALVPCLIFPCFLVFAATPFVVESQPGTFDMIRQGYLPARFLLCAATLSVVALCLCLDAPRGVARRDGNYGGARLIATTMTSARWIFGVAALSQLWPARQLRQDGDALAVVLAGTDLFLFALMVGDMVREWPAARVRRMWAFPALVVISIAISSLGAGWHAGFAQFYNVFYQTRLISKLESEAAVGERLCVLAYRTYPFLGSRRQFEVFGPVWVPTYQDLRDYVLNHHPDRVITIERDVVGPHRYDRINGWAKEHGELFHQTYYDYRFNAYRCAGAELRAPARRGNTQGNARERE